VKKMSLTQAILGSQWLQSGAIAHSDGSTSKGFEVEPLSSGLLEESFEGPMADSFFSKLSDLLTKLPNRFEGQVILCRRSLSDRALRGFNTRLYFFEKTQKTESYSHLNALLSELKLDPQPIAKAGWNDLLVGVLGKDLLTSRLPDLTWERSAFESGTGWSKYCR
jgi:hypothetical protein